VVLVIAAKTGQPTQIVFSILVRTHVATTRTLLPTVAVAVLNANAASEGATKQDVVQVLVVVPVDAIKRASKILHVEPAVATKRMPLIRHVVPDIAPNRVPVIRNVVPDIAAKKGRRSWRRLLNHAMPDIVAKKRVANNLR